MTLSGLCCCRIHTSLLITHTINYSEVVELQVAAMTCCRRIAVARGLSLPGHRRVCSSTTFSCRDTRYPNRLPSAVEVRCFVSLPNYIEHRATLSRPGVILAGCPSTSAGASHEAKDQALVVAAEEANRLLVQSGNHNDKSKAFPLSDSILIDHVDSIFNAVVDAANKLLLVSESLQEKIGTENLLTNEHQLPFTKYVTVLHRAFLALTTKCLDAIRITETTPSKERAETLLKLALDLSKRAHRLGLPYHLPLYQRLMEDTALTRAKSNTTDGISTDILDVASHTESLGSIVPLPCAMFRPAILALIANKRFDDVVHLLNGMRDRHGLAVLDRQTASEIYVNLHSVVKGSFCIRLESRRDLPESSVTEIVAMLEPSILTFSNEWAKETKAKHDKLKHLLESLDEFEMESMISSLNEKESHEEGTDDYVSDDDADEYLDDGSNLLMLSAKKIDPLDQAVHAIITKRVKNETTKAIFADMVRAFSNLSNVPKFVAVATNLTNEEEENLDFWSDLSSDSDDDDDDDDEETMGHWMNSRRNRLPDITAQIVTLNHGRSLKFTRSYENMMWMNYGDDDKGADEQNGTPHFEYSEDEDSGDDDSDSDGSSDSDDDGGNDYR
jgi:hypothetical protein